MRLLLCFCVVLTMAGCTPSVPSPIQLGPSATAVAPSPTPPDNCLATSKPVSVTGGNYRFDTTYTLADAMGIIQCVLAREFPVRQVRTAETVSCLDHGRARNVAGRTIAVTFCDNGVYLVSQASLETFTSTRMRMESILFLLAHEAAQTRTTSNRAQMCMGGYIAHHLPAFSGESTQEIQRMLPAQDIEGSDPWKYVAAGIKAHIDGKPIEACEHPAPSDWGSPTPQATLVAGGNTPPASARSQYVISFLSARQPYAAR